MPSDLDPVMHSMLVIRIKQEKASQHLAYDNGMRAALPLRFCLSPAQSRLLAKSTVHRLMSLQLGLLINSAI